jgi:ATP synthase protein I
MSQSGSGGGDDSDLRAIRDRLRDLDKKLDHAAEGRPVQKDAPDSARGQAMGMAFRIATELVAGVFVGGLLGWALDKWLGTAPFLLIVFLLLGIAGGLLNSIRAAMKMQNTSNRS